MQLKKRTFIETNLKMLNLVSYIKSNNMPYVHIQLLFLDVFVTYAYFNPP